VCILKQQQKIDDEMKSEKVWGFHTSRLSFFFRFFLVLGLFFVWFLFSSYPLSFLC